jgi:LacI family gluconate utilization system Gnt-I transcriptional repressor
MQAITLAVLALRNSLREDVIPARNASMQETYNPGSHLARRAPTLKSVADLAGVSTATVSRFLNVPAVVANETAARIRDAIEVTGYVPNLIAGELASNRSRLVSVIVPSLSQSIFNDTVDGIVEELAKAGYSVMLGLSGEGDSRFNSVLDAAMARRPDGVILTGGPLNKTHAAKLKAAGFTVIETWDLPAAPIDIAIGFSHHEVGRVIGAFIADRGYLRPHVITASGTRARHRLEGLMQALLGRELPPPTVEFLGGATRFGEGRQRFGALVDRGGPLADVIICSSDWLAQGVLVEARVRGIAVPETVSVIGFGNLGMSGEMDPPMTTVEINGRAIGAGAAAALLDRAQGRTPMPFTDVGFGLIERATTRPAPS